MKRSFKEELVRVVRMPDGVVCIDEKHKLDGRGVYICKSEKCLDNAIKRKWLQRNLKCDIEASIFDDLRKCVNPGE